MLVRCFCPRCGVASGTCSSESEHAQSRELRGRIRFLGWNSKTQRLVGRTNRPGKRIRRKHVFRVLCGNFRNGCTKRDKYISRTGFLVKGMFIHQEFCRCVPLLPRKRPGNHYIRNQGSIGPCAFGSMVLLRATVVCLASLGRWVTAPTHFGIFGHVRP